MIFLVSTLIIINSAVNLKWGMGPKGLQSICYAAGCAQRTETPPRLLYCLGDHSCVVGEKRGGAPCRVEIRRRKPALRYIRPNGRVKMIVDPHPASYQHPKLITSRESPLVHAYHVWSTSVATLSCSHRTTERSNATIT